LLAIFARLAQAAEHRKRPPTETVMQPHVEWTPEQRARAELVRKRGNLTAAIGVIVVLVLVAGGFLATRLSQSSALSVGDPITLHVTDADGNFAITNRTDSTLTLCWAERSSSRASLPTLVRGATVTVGPGAFRPIDGAHRGSDLRITCDVDGDNVAAVIQ
jgi:hypothetical protein